MQTMIKILLFIEEKNEVDLIYPFTLFSTQPIFHISSWLRFFSIFQASNMIYIGLTKNIINIIILINMCSHLQKQTHKKNGWNIEANMQISLHLCSHWMQTSKSPSLVPSILVCLQILQQQHGQNQSPSGISYSCRGKSGQWKTQDARTVVHIWK